MSPDRAAERPGGPILACSVGRVGRAGAGKSPWTSPSSAQTRNSLEPMRTKNCAAEVHPSRDDPRGDHDPSPPRVTIVARIEGVTSFFPPRLALGTRRRNPSARDRARLRVAQIAFALAGGDVQTAAEGNRQMREVATDARCALHGFRSRSGWRGHNRMRRRAARWT